ncbi:hypothetical protein [Methylobacterium sp. WL6]|uniref:hypothetical protein n=1 Tax=Methylobacterium sp. WL6 TaxID=2603901 RepID=UPI0011C74E8F|nr:hypothetical protein [Methylobacterium sp. WL6]TXN60180.1 hypothetical protein FV230_26625 [Methylobacterium sp. WL6]
MPEPKPALVCRPMPPLNATLRRDRRPPGGTTLSRLGRLAACLVALALPALGIAAADTVHRVATPGALQAAAPGSPSRAAAVLDGASRVGSPVREALLLTPDRDPRR